MEIGCLFDHKQRSYKLEGITSIGRHEGCQIIIDGIKVSREHAQILQRGREYRLVDNGSKNGTYLNGQRVLSAVVLKPGDTIDLGGNKFTFELRIIEQNNHTTALDLTESKNFILVTDIVSSTKHIRELGNRKYAEMMSSWFSEASAIIRRQQGEINQSTGDGVLALWNNGDSVKESVERAFCELNAYRLPYGVKFRLCLHYGSISRGGLARVGADQISGQAIHFAFRMDKVAKKFKCTSLFSQDVVKQLKCQNRVREVDEVEMSESGFPGRYMFYTWKEQVAGSAAN